MREFNFYFAGTQCPESTEVITKLGANVLKSYVNDKAELRDVWFPNKRNGYPGKLLIDNGAFTIHKRGGVIDIDKYIAWLNENDDAYDYAVSLDHIPGRWGMPKSREDVEYSARQTYKNFIYMKEHLKSPQKLWPVFHMGESFEHYEAFLNIPDIKCICISGRKDLSMQAREEWYTKCFSVRKKLNKEHINIHILGSAHLENAENFPITSMDATTWIMAGMNGCVLTEYGTIYVGDELNTLKYKEPKKSYDYIKSLCDKYEINIEDLGQDYKARMCFNVRVLFDKMQNPEYKPKSRMHKNGLFKLSEVNITDEDYIPSHYIEPQKVSFSTIIHNTDEDITQTSEIEHIEAQTDNIQPANIVLKEKLNMKDIEASEPIFVPYQNIAPITSEPYVATKTGATKTSESYKVTKKSYKKSKDSCVKVLLYSGGMDSWLIDKIWKPDIKMYIDMHTEYSKQEISRLGNDVKIVDFPFLNKYTLPNSIIPLRNVYLYLIAANETLFDNVEICIGALDGDRILDKSQEFADKLNDLMQFLYQDQQSQPGRTIRITMPFKNYSKRELCEMYVKEGGNLRDIYDNSFTCYHPVDNKECLSCKACFRKAIPFIVAGMEFTREEKEKLLHFRDTHVLTNMDDYVKDKGKEGEDCLRALEIMKHWQSKKSIIAVDFDCTVTDNTPYPKVGELRENCYDVLWWLKNRGHTLYLYTARKGKWLKEAIDLVHKWNLPLDIPERSLDEYCLDKVEADVYIDDRSIFVDEIDWMAIKNLLEKKGY